MFLDHVFDFSNYVSTQSLMDKRIKPWVTKKIVEYIGEEEATLTEFICQKVVARSSPQSIQNDVAMVSFGSFVHISFLLLLYS